MNEMLEWLILMVFQLIIFGVTVWGNLGCVKWWWPFHQVLIIFRRALNFGNGQLCISIQNFIPARRFETGKALFDNGSTKNNFQWGWPPTYVGCPLCSKKFPEDKVVAHAGTCGLASSPRPKSFRRFKPS